MNIRTSSGFKKSFRNLFVFLFFICALSLFSVHNVEATISATPVHQYTGASLAGSGSYTITLTSTPATGNTLIFTSGGNNTASHPVASLSQTGVTWTKAISSATTSSLDIWYGVVGSSPGTTLTITLTGSAATSAIGNLSEWSGISPIPLDQTGFMSGTSATPFTSSTTPQAGTDVLIIGLARKGGTATVISPATALSSTDGSFSPAYRVVTNASGSYVVNWSYSSSGGWAATVATFKAQIVDATPPSVPSGLNGTAFSPTRIDLSWSSSTDNQAVSYYTLYRCSGTSCTPTTSVASSTVLSYSDTGLTSSTTYGYAVTATDLQGNESTKSSSVYISTPSTDTLPPVLSNGSPTGTVTVNPLNATLSVTTDENATCKYGTVASTAYASIASTFSTTGGTSHSQSLTGLSAGTNTYYVRCIDSATNANLSDYTITFTMALADITAPLISITAPTNGATVSNTVTFTASSSDNIGVVGVKFFLDGILFGTEKTGTSITSTSTSWASASFASDGTHTIYATVRDAAGNRATSSIVTLNVNNSSNWKFRTVSYNGSTYNFSVFVPPGYTASTSWPIILAMTGQASFPFPDNDGYSQIRLDFGEYTIRAAENTFPAITVFPQYVNTSGLTNNEAIALQDAIAMAAFNQELAEFNVDMNRVYLVGSSYGGLRSWGLLYNNSNLFAAMVTLSGGNSNPFEITGNASDTLAATNALTVTRLLTKPIWMFHSLGDGQALSQYDRDMYAAFQAASSTSVIYTQYPGSTHSLWVSPWGFNDPAITNPDALTWLMAQTLDADATSPTVSLTAPSNLATVSGSSVSVTATSSDNVGVVGVQFKLDGALLGSEDTTSTYGITWDSTTATNGSHTLVAVSRDAAGNRATSSSITVTVSNAGDTTAPTTPTSLTGTVISPTQVNITWASSTDAVGVTAYKVYRCTGASCSPTTFIATSTILSYTDTTLSQSTQYGFAVSAVDAAFNESTKSSTFATTTTSSADVTVPTVSVTAPTNLATVSGASVSVTANASDNVGVSGVQFKLDGINLGSEDITSTYGITWDSTTATNGSHTIVAVARDAAGNYATSSSITVTVSNSDVTVPTVSITAPSNLATVSGASVSVTANAADNIGVFGVQFKLDNINLGSEDTTSTYGITWDTTSASNGSHTLVAVARDATGNYATSSSITVTVSNTVPDTTAPTAPTSLTGTVSPSQVALTWASSTDAVGVTAYKVYRCTGASCSPTTFVATTTVLNYTDTSLSQTTQYGFAVSAVDAAFNESTKSSTFATTTTSSADVTSPSVSITSPATIAIVAGSISVTADAADNVGIVGVQFKLDGALLGSEDTTSAYGITWDTSTVADGSHTLLAVARDAAGNRATSSSVIITVLNADVTAPIISLTYPTNGSALSGTVNVIASATDNTSVAGVQFKLDGVNLSSEVTVAPYTMSWDTTSVANGVHSLSMVARDGSGNLATASANVTISNGVASSGGGGGGGGSSPSQTRRTPPVVSQPVSSQSPASILQAQIDLVQSYRSVILEIQALGVVIPQIILDLLQASNSTSVVTTISSVPNPNITRNLKLGDTGYDVTRLQQSLIAANAGPASVALRDWGLTRNFAGLTQAALAEFQTAVGILPATGSFGPRTSAYFATH